MFKKILVPVDLTDSHQRALEIASGLAGAAGGEVTLLHVIELIHGLPMDEEKDFYQRLARKARAYLERLLDRLEGPRKNVRVVVVYGDRAREIIRQAGEGDADLIVLTSHRVEAGTSPARFGTLSHAVGIFAQCPVLLVK
jgi:nucleotide-binding universal stress UspA family protein